MKRSRLLIHVITCLCVRYSQAQEQVGLINISERCQSALAGGPSNYNFSVSLRSSFERRFSLGAIDLFAPERLFTQEKITAAATAGMARNLAFSGVRQGLREAFTSIPNVVDFRARYGGFGDFVVNSIGKVEEGNVDPDDLTVIRPELSLLEDLHHERRIQYGIRPFSTSPYVFVTTRISLDGTDILFLDARYGEKELTGQWASVVAGFPIGGCIVTFGGEYRTYARERNEDAFTLNFGIQREFAWGRFSVGGGIVTSHPSFLAAFTRPL